MAVAMVLSITTTAAPALADQQVYVYSIIHPTYGDIGTLTDTISRGLETTRIDSRLRIAVKFLGMVVSRQESDTTEIMQGNRMVLLDSVTKKDGRHLEVHGAAQGDQFVVKTTNGSVIGPASILPSDPWMLKRTGEQTVIFTDTGRITVMRISGGDVVTISLNGAPVSAQHFTVTGDKHQEVWLDSREVPVMFRTVEDGTAVDFVLQHGPPATTDSVDDSARPSVLMPLQAGSK
jgi:hypothetical protein